jgi:hypothetical protein
MSGRERHGVVIAVEEAKHALQRRVRSRI